MNDTHTQPATAEHLAAALTAVVVAMAAIKPDTREQAQHLHHGYLTAQGIDDSDIAAHWAQFGDNYTKSPSKNTTA